MSVPFSERPGRHERHFRRKLNTDLFPRPIGEYSDEDLLEVQRLDHEELLEFLAELRATVQRAVDLSPNEESQVVLDLKAGLEQLYERAAGLADHQESNKSAIAQLVGVIMQTVRRGAAGDSLAEQELLQEEQARVSHFRLLEQPVVADLLHPESLIEADEIVPVLLLESPEGLAAALEMFDREQLAQLCQIGQDLLLQVPEGSAGLAAYRERLLQMERAAQGVH